MVSMRTLAGKTRSQPFAKPDGLCLIRLKGLKFMQTTMNISRRFVETSSGRVHVAECGEGMPVLLLHQTPRSWDEFRDVLPRLGQSFRAIAMDTRGFGDSDGLPVEKVSIEGWATAAIELAEALGLGRFAAVGHHTGAVIALEMAAQVPDRITGLVLSAIPLVNSDRRAKHEGARMIDEVTIQPDGGHLMELWQRRAPFYPEKNRPELLHRFISDALKAGPMMVEGHRVVNRYHMEDRIGLVSCPTLILVPMLDPHVSRVARRVSAMIA